MKKQLFIFTYIATIFFVSCCHAQELGDSQMVALSDSLNQIKYEIPKLQSKGCFKSIIIRTQREWDCLETRLDEELKKGENNLRFCIKGKDIVFGRERKEIVGLCYPNANICIEGEKAKMVPFGIVYKKDDINAQYSDGFFILPCDKFNINDIIIDSKGNEVPFRENTKQVDGNIVNAKDGNDVWKFKVELPDLSEQLCKDFYVLLTRDWTSARHQVIKVKDGWLYYHLDSGDLHSERDPNVDWIKYGVRPRYTLINNPVSKGVHFVNGKIYVPENYEFIRVNKGSQLITFASCHFNSLEISGFKLNGCGNGYASIGIYSCKFGSGAYIHDNTFTNMSSMAISATLNRNVCIANNKVQGTRQQALEGGGVNTTIYQNSLKDIGWMLNTFAITGGGEHLHICENVIEDFNYGAIGCGTTRPNKDNVNLTYIIERNEVALSNSFVDNYIKNTLADGGGIYSGPQCTQGIIRYNIVKNIKGIHSNRGIFLDDGGKNLAIYGNLVANTHNCYDIDLRLTGAFAEGIPDHNTGNCIFYNILTGGYRFQDKGEGSRCFGGQNLMLGTGPTLDTKVNLQSRARDVHIESTAPSRRAENILYLSEKVKMDKYIRKRLNKTLNGQ